MLMQIQYLLPVYPEKSRRMADTTGAYSLSSVRVVLRLPYYSRLLIPRRSTAIIAIGVMPSMNFTNLKYFLVLAEELNFTKAAKHLYISQQSLSSHISKLEHYFGTELFDRTPPMTLTSAGRCLVTHAKTILDTKQEVCRQISDIRDFKSGEITVGVTLSRGSILLPLILPAYQEKYPNVRIRIFQSNSQALENALHGGLVDLIIGFTPSDGYNIVSEFLSTEEFVLVISNKILKSCFPSSHEEIAQRLMRYKDLSLIEECPFITMPESTRVGAVYISAFKEKGLTPNTYLTVANVETMVALCMKHIGGIICPKSFVKGFASPAVLANEFQVIPMKLTAAPPTISISYLKNKYLPIAAQEFIEVTKEAIPMGWEK